MPRKENKKQPNKYIRFTSIAIQMGITIYLGSLLGEWLDIKYHNKNELYKKIITLGAVFFAMYSVIRQVSNISKNND